MPSLLETNPYLRDPETRRRMLERNALDSFAKEARQVVAAQQVAFALIPGIEMPGYS